MNNRARKRLAPLVRISLALPLLLGSLTLGDFGSDTAALAAEKEAPAPMNAPARAELLYKTAVFVEAAGLMTPESLHGNLIPEYADGYATKIADATQSIAKNPSSTPSQLTRALKYVQFSLVDFYEKGQPNTGYILIKMETYFLLHFPTSEAPGGYSQAKLEAWIAKLQDMRSRLNAGANDFSIYVEFVEGRHDFYAHPNP